eukprot:CAMPEP_0203670872 /NCGR_PEP_ID=MMETSP0090-20130426/6833_1 /ASSEMBLY_ACC=CAM_ASM_001088 /TAXON_ID=426623 /ORGANISM="Chaetoceros affinis, Strain CCMP159" /LENGTH=1032 /DNA_ID=CAMNT_0050535845 /DNA_START=281 /DNA_END=3379 /DNA_ORIENTATION=+
MSAAAAIMAAIQVGGDHSSSTSSTSTAAAMEAPYGQIPQHRVRTTKRRIEYNSDHPWYENLDETEEDGTKGAASGDIQANEVIDDTGSKILRERSMDVNEDELPISKNIIWWTESNHDSSGSESGELYQPIRIRASLISHYSSGYNFLSPRQRREILKMIQPALNNWSRALSVLRVEGNLTIDREQLYDELSCGPGIDSDLPSVVVPEDHIVLGESGVDLMVYISVGFTVNVDLGLNKEKTAAETTKSPSSPPSLYPTWFDNTENTPSEYHWANFSNYSGPSSFFENSEENDDTESNEPSPAASSPPNATEEPSALPSEFPSTFPTSTPTVPPRYCSGTYLASATYCSTDQFDRPVAGLLDLCIGPNFFDVSSQTINHLTIMHEVGHILGLNSHSLAHFRDRDTGEPITARTEDGDVPDVEVECTGVKEGRGNATIPLPSENILKFKEVRGVRVAEIITPNVQKVVRNRFHCLELDGAELESPSFHPFNQTCDNCIGDHWERRLFKNDIMNPIIDSAIHSALISPLTLAYFLDSGWYRVDSSRAYSADVWGRGAGCGFVNNRCLNHEGKISKANLKFFCNGREKSQYGCTDDISGKAQCNMVQFDAPLPAEFQYFGRGVSVGGPDADLDYCPIFVEMEQGSCKNNPAVIPMKSRLDSPGLLESRCVTGKSGGNDLPLCLPVACAYETRTLHVKVDGYWKLCNYTGQIINSWWYEKSDFVVCPNPVLACPTFSCPRDCLQNSDASICDFRSGNCVCQDSNVDGFSGSPSNSITCNNDITDITEYSSLSEYYVSHPSMLKDDGKNILDHAARMFITMSVGEVISFVACSLLVVVSFTIISIYLVTVLRQRRDILSFCPRWISRANDWRTDMVEHWSSLQSQRTDQADKDKMVASVLHNMRVQNTAHGIEHGFEEEIGNIDDNFLGESQNQHEATENQNNLNNHVAEETRTIFRSQLPPLPGSGVGRILSIPGYTYVDDTIQFNDQDELLTAAERTAIGSRTSCRSSQLESCSVQSVRESHCDIELIEPSIRRRK